MVIEGNYVSKQDFFTFYHDWYQIFNVIHIRDRVHTIDSIKLYIYSEDNAPHNVPHLHAYYQDKSIIIDLKSLKIIKGNLPIVQQKKALKWIEKNKDFLHNKWNELNSGVQIPVI